MKFHLVSDLHIDHYSDMGRKLLQRISKNASNVDGIIVAGDLGPKNRLRYAFSILCDNYKNVIYTTGNHEYYGTDKQSLEDLVNAQVVKRSNLHFLNNSSCEIDGQRFLGGTLWFTEGVKARELSFNWSDFDHIKNSNWLWEANYKCLEYLEGTVVHSDIVVTHHLPIKECIHPNWANDKYNCFYTGGAESIVRYTRPKCWVYGHTHNFMKFTVERTNFHCNPYGYRVEKSEYQSNYIIDTDSGTSELLEDYAE